jgi:hypothetical protein
MGKSSTQIPNTLWFDLLRYHLIGEGEYDEATAERIRNGICDVIEAQTRHALYTKYKTSPTEKEREKARQEYLDRAGIPSSFRW